MNETVVESQPTFGGKEEFESEPQRRSNVALYGYTTLALLTAAGWLLRDRELCHVCISSSFKLTKSRPVLMESVGTDPAPIRRGGCATQRRNRRVGSRR